MPSLTKRSFLKLAGPPPRFPPCRRTPRKAGKVRRHDRRARDRLRRRGSPVAITAHDAGAKVLLLEKMPPGGGNTEASGGGFIIPKDAGQAYEYLGEDLPLRRQRDGRRAREDLLRGGGEAARILQADRPGRGFASRATRTTRTAARRQHGTGGGKKSGGIELIAALKKCVEERKIETSAQLPALELIREGNTVVGATAHDGRVVRMVRIRRGVILTTGG